MLANDSSAYNRDKISLPKLIPLRKLKTNSKIWIDNYFKDDITSNQNIDNSESDELQLSNKRSTEYKLWLEAGKVRSTSMPNAVDLSYDYNIWRNFKKCFLEDKEQHNHEDEDIIEEVAKLYPVTVPKPSKLNGNDIIKYTESSRSISDPIKKQIIIEKLRKDKQYMEQLKLRSLLRNPPIDEQGNIQPPDGYKKYQQYFFPDPIFSIEPKGMGDGSQIPDVFGRINDRIFRPSLWKLTSKPRNPRYMDAMRYREMVTAASGLLL